MDKNKNIKNNKILLFLPLVILVIGLAGISFIKSSRESQDALGKNPKSIIVYQGGQQKEITDQTQCNAIVSLINESIDKKKLKAAEMQGLENDKQTVELSRQKENAVEIIYDTNKTLELSGSPLKYNRLFFQVSNNSVEEINGIAYGQGPEYTTIIKLDLGKVKEKLNESISKAFK